MTQYQIVLGKKVLVFLQKLASLDFKKDAFPRLDLLLDSFYAVNGLVEFRLITDCFGHIHVFFSETTDVLGLPSCDYQEQSRGGSSP